MTANEMKPATFYVYTYRRPDGSPFYVGKGTRERAMSLSPSRRTEHFMNVVRKHGRDRVRVDLVQCASEREALCLEVEQIRLHRAAGADLVNLTDGGEGVSGRPMPEKSREAFAGWHGAFSRLPDDAKSAVLDALKRGRETASVWRASPAGREHIARLAAAGAENLHRERTIVCEQCGEEAVVRSGKARFCSSRCRQISLRAAEKEKRGPLSRRAVSEETRAKMSAAKIGRPLSAEHRKRISDGNSGKTLTEETKRKIGVANKKVRAGGGGPL